MSYKYIVEVEFDGSKFAGYGTQVHKNTVQDKIEDVLTKINSNNFVKTFASSRTDSKVHALSLFIQFNLNHKVNLNDFKYKLNRLLGSSINVKKVLEDFDDNINVRYDVVSKTYLYKVNKNKNPFIVNYSNYVFEQLDIKKMKEASKYLIGEHDFSSFCNNKTYVTNKIRTINYIKIKEEEDEINIFINGNGFLYNMVRIIVGTLLNVGKGLIEPIDVKTILENKKRDTMAPIEKPEGLYLKETLYKEENV